MKKTLLVVMVLVLLASFVIPVGAADDFSRKGKGEVYGVFQMMGSDTTSGSAGDVDISIQLDDSTAYGVGFGVNMSDNFNLNTEILFGTVDMDADVDGTPVAGDSTLFIWNVNLDYYLLKERLTPMATVGLGFMNFSGDLTDGDTTASFSETDFSYNFGFGGRWDVTDNLFVKALYKWTMVTMKDTDNALSLDGFVISAGLRF